MKKTVCVFSVCAAVLLVAAFSGPGALSLSRSQMALVCGGSGCPVTAQLPDANACLGKGASACVDKDDVCSGIEAAGCPATNGNLSGGTPTTNGTWSTPACPSFYMAFPCVYVWHIWHWVCEGVTPGTAINCNIYFYNDWTACPQ